MNLSIIMTIMIFIIAFVVGLKIIKPKHIFTVIVTVGIANACALVGFLLTNIIAACFITFSGLNEQYNVKVYRTDIKGAQISVSNGLTSELVLIYTDENGNSGTLNYPFKICEEDTDVAYILEKQYISEYNKYTDLLDYTEWEYHGKMSTIYN